MHPPNNPYKCKNEALSFHDSFHLCNFFLGGGAPLPLERYLVSLVRLDLILFPDNKRWSIVWDSSSRLSKRSNSEFPPGSSLIVCSSTVNDAQRVCV